MAKSYGDFGLNPFLAGDVSPIDQLARHQYQQQSEQNAREARTGAVEGTIAAEAQNFSPMGDAPIEGPQADVGMNPKQLAERNHMFAVVADRVMSGNIDEATGLAMKKQIQARMRSRSSYQPTPQDRFNQQTYVGPDGGVYSFDQNGSPTMLESGREYRHQQALLDLQAKKDANEYDVKMRQMKLDEAAAEKQAESERVANKKLELQTEKDKREAESEARLAPQREQAEALKIKRARDTEWNKIQTDLFQQKFSILTTKATGAQSRYEKARDAYESKNENDVNDEGVPNFHPDFDETPRGRALLGAVEAADTALEGLQEPELRGLDDEADTVSPPPATAQPTGVPAPSQTGKAATPSPAATDAGGAITPEAIAAMPQEQLPQVAQGVWQGLQANMADPVAQANYVALQKRISGGQAKPAPVVPKAAPASAAPVQQKAEQPKYGFDEAMKESKQVSANYQKWLTSTPPLPKEGPAPRLPSAYPPAKPKQKSADEYRADQESERTKIGDGIGEARKELADVERKLEKGRHMSGRPLTDAERADLQKTRDEAERIWRGRIDAYNRIGQKIGKAMWKE